MLNKNKIFDQMKNYQIKLELPSQNDEVLDELELELFNSLNLPFSNSDWINESVTLVVFDRRGHCPVLFQCIIENIVWLNPIGFSIDCTINIVGVDTPKD